MFAQLLETLQIQTSVASTFLIFMLPLCAIVAHSDLRGMRIPNWTVDLTAAIYIIVGLFVMPSWPDYGWQLLHLPVGLLIGFLLYAGGAVGAGDAKFVAAAAPFVDYGDLALILLIFCANLLAGFTTHRVAKYTALHKMAPDWKSWHVGAKFPMGFCLGTTLVIYLALGAFYGT
ncbi:prepilin peptidase [Epibacterium ulvae]|uniref:prepilin peptidase n=1 Tax=Epibacterium ulvae TaxID=1156985 RepID=UPI00249207DC|nr:prepilin peptidase [Epibacterium ulvae]